MVENRSLPDLAYGDIGRLTYIPSSDPEDGPGRFHTSRLLSDQPTFRVISSAETWISPQKSPDVDELDRVRPHRRIKKQERWLLKTHPSAFIATGTPIYALVQEDLDHSARSETAVLDTPLLAFGEMTDFSYSAGPVGTQLLATAGGVSGQTLRLVRVRKWALGWGEERADRIDAWELDADDAEDETTWTGDAVPISKIRFATSLARYDPTRWLLVQKSTSTTILRPEYYASPVPRGGSGPRARPSRIYPRVLATINASQTGGRAQVDMSFNPGSARVLPQIAIVDERGYWTVWDARRGRMAGVADVRLEKVGAGHIREGVADGVPRTGEHPTERHGILWVGKSGGEDPDWVDDGKVDESVAERSRTLLVWGPLGITIIDAPSTVRWPAVNVLSRSRTGPETVLDVQLSPVNRSQVLVLTSRHLLWLDLFPKGSSASPERRSPSVLVKSPHLRDPEDRTLRFASCPGGKDPDGNYIIVMLYSAQDRDLTAYWLWPGQRPGLEQHHRQLLSSVGDLKSTNYPPFQTLHLTPLGPSYSPSPEGPQEGHFAGSGVLFYQVLAISQDLSLRSSICAAFVPGALIPDVPELSMRVAVNGLVEKAKWRRKWRKLASRVETAFVVPEGMGDLTILARKRAKEEDPGGGSTLGEEEQCSGKTPGPPRKIRFVRMWDEVQKCLEEGAGEGDGLPSSTLFGTVRDGINHLKIDKGSFAPQTLFELAGGLEALDRSVDVDGWENGLDSVFALSHEGVRVQKTFPCLTHGPDSRAGVRDVGQSLARVWFDTLPPSVPDPVRRRRLLFTGQLAVGIALSNYAMTLPPPALLPSPSLVASRSTTPAIFGSALPSPSQSAHASPSSRSSSTGRRKRRLSASSIARDKASEAISRLVALAPINTNTPLARARQSPVLAYWPEQTGVPTTGYVSSVAEASDRRFDAIRGAREKRARAEARRARMRERYLPSVSSTPGSQEGDGRARERMVLRGPPAIRVERPPVIVSSQGHAETWSQSQSQGESQMSFSMTPQVIMSQPLTGPHGGDTRKKKPNKPPHKIRGFR